MTDLRHRGDLALGDRPIQGHFGLVLDKLAARFDPDEPMKIDKDEVLRRLMGQSPQQRPYRQREVGVAEKRFLDRQHARLQALVATNGSSRHYVTMGPLAIGLGNSSPLENGITIHPTYGVPFIPGSAIKGMVAAWAEHWEGFDDNKLQMLLGHAKGGEKALRLGGVTFLDALPRPPVRVVADVMTPHAGPYYGDPPLPPADWHSPNPISFIAVPEGQLFAVRFSVNGRAAFDPEILPDPIGEVARLLEAAFTTIGIGAKTAAGYGRLAPHD